MAFGASIWGPPLIAAGASWLASKGKSQGETKEQKRKRKLIDQLLGSIEGQGPYSDLFNADPEAFQKSFVEPAQAMFRNQIAPQIQQQYISSGQQRGTGLDDQLLRAGVDLDMMLNQQYYQFNQDALNRKQNTIGNILGSNSGGSAPTSTGQDVMSGLGGYLSSDQFASQFSNVFKPKTTAPTYEPLRRGYAPG